MDTSQKIKELEEELRTTKYNKRTQHAVGLLKARIARLKSELELAGKKGGKHTGFLVKKSGDATVAFVGYPSVGKSTLLNALTNANSEVGAYDFTTVDVVPGTLLHKGARIQLLDIPGFVDGAAEGVGRGREILSAVRMSELMLIVLDNRTWDRLPRIKEELYNAKIRINQSLPNVSIKKRGHGGIDLSATLRLTKLDTETAKAIMREMGFANASIVIREDIDQDELIDVLEGNRVYLPAIVVMNKADLIDEPTRKRIEAIVKPDIFVSAECGQNIEQLKELIFRKLGLIRVYMKQPGKEADMEEPMILRAGVTVGDVCAKLHRDLVRHLKYARVWGSSKFPGQKLGPAYRLMDGDVVELHLD